MWVSDYSRIETEEGERLSILAGVVDEKLSRQLVAVNNALTGIRDDLAEMEVQKDGHAIIIRRLLLLSEALPGVQGMMVFNSEGTIVEANMPS